MTCGDTCGTADWNIAHLVGKAPGDQAPTIRIDRPVQPSLRCRTVGQESAFVVGIGFRSRAPGPARAGHRSLRRGKRDVSPATLVAGDAGHAQFSCRQGAGHSKPHEPELGYVQLGPFPVQRAHLRVSNTKPFMQVLAPPRRPPMRRREEPGARAVEISQRLLLHTRRSITEPGELLAGFGQLPHALCRTRGRPTRPAPIELLHCHTNRASAQCRSSITQAPTCPPTGNAYNQLRTRHRPSRLRPDLSTTGTP